MLTTLASLSRTARLARTARTAGGLLDFALGVFDDALDTFARSAFMLGHDNYLRNIGFVD
jgi:hypothetical protein